MDYIYAPWRSAYFSQKKSNCIFCDMVNDKENDEKNMVLFRDTKCYGVMNLFPYTPRHFMIVPYEHEDGIEKLDIKTWEQMSLHVRNGVKLFKEHFGYEGVNIGMNLGKVGGAGIAQHVHYHLVPRSQRDTNFITTIGNSRVNGVDFKEIYEETKIAVPKYFELENR